MNIPERDVPQPEPKADGVSLALQPIGGPRSERWAVQLDDELLSLLTPDGRLVLMLPREEAARHLRFDWDLPRGRLISFMVAEGLRGHRFRCGARERRVLLEWLPQKPWEEMEKEVRRYGIAFVLTGVFQLLFPAYFFRVLGLAFVLEGLVVISLPKRYMYTVNALLMFAAGLILLFAPKPLAVNPDLSIQWGNVLPTGLGSLLLIWSIQQVSLLSANHQLRVARARTRSGAPGTRSGAPGTRSGAPGSSESAFEEAALPSGAIKKVTWGVTFIAVLLVGQVAGLFLQLWLGESPPLFRDWVLCLVLASLTIGMVAVLRWRPHAAYLEAKLAGQFAVGLAVLYVAGVLNADLEGSLPFPPEILWLGLFTLYWPYVWVPLVALVFLFSRWFTRAVEKELAERSE